MYITLGLKFSCDLVNNFVLACYSSSVEEEWSFPDSSGGKESACSAGDPSFIPGSERSAGEGKGYPLQYSWTSLVTAGKESTCNVWDLSSIPGLGRFPGEGKGCPLQYCGLENSMGCIDHGFTKSQTWLKTLTFTSSVNIVRTDIKHRDLQIFLLSIKQWGN